MSSLEDPRVYFAAERTMLAWVRTGLGAMGLGLVTAKFGVFLRLMAHEMGHGAHDAAKDEASVILGVAITLMGSLMCLLSAIQFQRFIASLGAVELPPRHLIGMAKLSAYVVALIGAVVALYLIW